ncbi:hypothetical protein BGZ73_006643 [Actinomortierella ambigua]|nr:hypothetical protein BGZ73_006643 [Actinomortierella ambigua]
MDTVAPMPAGADWQDHATTNESQMGTNTLTTTNNALHDSTVAKKQRPPVMVLTGSYSTPVIVGRGSQATLNLGRINKQVSRRHAIIEWHAPTSQFRISVLGQNGVRINGVGFPSGQQCPLKRGDVVDLVGVKMVFKTPSSPPPSSAAVQAFHSNTYRTQDQHHHGDSDEQDENQHHHHYAMSSPMSTPTKKPSIYTQGTTGVPQSPASSPARFSDPQLPSSPVAARMLQKMLKYESRGGEHAANQQHLQSPPPSDPPTELGFMPSPVKSRPLFDMVEPDSPERMMPTLHLHKQTPPRQPLFHNHALHNNNHNNSNNDTDNVFLVTASAATTAATSHNTVRAPLANLQVDAPSTTNNTNHSDTPRHTLTVTRVENVLASKPVRKVPEDEEKEGKKEKEVKKLPEATFKLSKPATKPVEHKQQDKVTATKMDKQEQQPKMVKKKKEEDVPRSTLTDKLQQDKKATSSVRKDGEVAENQVKALQKSAKKESSSSSTRPTAADSTGFKGEKTTTKVRTESDEKKLKKQQKQQKQEDDKEAAEAAALKAEKKKQKKAKEASTKDTEETSSSPSSSPSNKTKTDYTEMIIDTLVFARKKKSMTLSELYDEMMVSQPSLVKAQDPVVFKEELLRCLSGAKCVGKIARKGKDAYNKPLESQWYYIPEMDHNVMRKLTRQEVMPSARKCTLKDKQYFFKMPPKLPYHRKSTSPYAVKPSRAKDVRLELTDDADADNRSSSSSSSSESDSEGEPLALLKKATLEKRKRADGAGSTKEERRTPSLTMTSQSKKRKTDESVQKASERRDTEGEEDEEVEPLEDSEDSEDEADQDSLDDLSELSGLEDHDN